MGRRSEALPNGSHVGTFKDALYADAAAAALLTGAVRVVCRGGECTMHVQLVPGAGPSSQLQQAIHRGLPAHLDRSRVVLWPYTRFPYGMTLDYERKFSYHVPGEENPAIL
jgi:phenylacetate-CoA ligase